MNDNVDHRRIHWIPRDPPSAYRCHEHHSENIIHESQKQLLELKKVGITSLDQAIHLLQDIITNDDQLTRKSSIISCSTIGKHLRHLHDHFRILLETVQSKSKTINYDIKSPSAFMENSRQVSLNEFRKTKRKLIELIDFRIKHFSQNQPDSNLNLITITPSKIQLQTNFNRELWYVSSHAIHHFALIKAIVTGELGLELPESFGVAPSTIARFQSKL
ncbi:hypothetical protein O181_001216 [Austropuccinia psidii MF-1]|uniref:DinB-like domain-containing protein n=1 Tax=Austropuccinia psidii MF-1 TaxID=1389203 RepID=A0A9Q3GC76_9BASI|nr:hypothetical protein [Austropuccinia psidii MF-1]